MKPILLAVDLSNQVYRATAAHATLRSEGVFTGGLFGFIVALSKAINMTKATRVVLCQDRKPYVRSVMYPEYKALRKNNRDETLVENFAVAMPQVLELAEVIGLPIWGVDGFESDDLIAHCVVQHRHRFGGIVAASNDSDLYQLFKWGDHFSIFKGAQKGFYRKEDFSKEWGLDTEQFLMALAMMGTHNEVAGIQGIGEVGAKKAVLNPAEGRKLMERHRELIERNMKLIKLPHADFPKNEPIPRMTRDFSDRAFIRHCSRFDIEVIKPMLDAFNRLT